MDAICPLRYVDALVTSENVYINVQKDKSLTSTDWDIKNPKFFKPFLK